jgi:hypothetical protein
MRSQLGTASAGCLVLGLSLSSAACSSDSGFHASANLAGEYTVAVTNADNGCMIENWEVGKSTSGIPFSIMQQDSNLNGTLEGAAGVVLLVTIGSNMFGGKAADETFDLTAYGQIPRMQGTCTFKLNAEIQGTISGDLISGTIKYAPAISNDPACASLQCSSTQNFNGTRPPP